MAEQWRCWFDDELREDGDDVETLFVAEDCAAEDAAETYVSASEQYGAFAGDPMPDVIAVYALAPSGRLYRVEVVPEYSVDFCARRAAAVEATEATDAG